MGFPECAACSPWRHGQRSVASRDSTFVQKKVKPEENEVCHTSLKIQPTGEFGCGRLGPSGGPIELSSDRYWSFATKCSHPRWLEQREAQRPCSWPDVLSTYGAEVRRSIAHDLESKDFRGPVCTSEGSVAVRNNYIRWNPPHAIATLSCGLCSPSEQ